MVIICILKFDVLYKILIHFGFNLYVFSEIIFRPLFELLDVISASS